MYQITFRNRWGLRLHSAEVIWYFPYLFCGLKSLLCERGMKGNPIYPLPHSILRKRVNPSNMLFAPETSYEFQSNTEQKT